MFIAALFTIAQIWKKPKFTSVGEGIKKKNTKNPVVHLYNRMLHGHKNKSTFTFCDSMDGTGIIILDEIASQRKTNSI